MGSTCIRYAKKNNAYINNKITTYNNETTAFLQFLVLLNRIRIR